jgi:hypothetical protein
MVSKALDFAREQGAEGFLKRSVHEVREHFESFRNAAPEQKMKLLKPFLHFLRGRDT